MVCGFNHHICITVGLYALVDDRGLEIRIINFTGRLFMDWKARVKTTTWNEEETWKYLAERHYTWESVYQEFKERAKEEEAENNMGDKPVIGDTIYSPSGHSIRFDPVNFGTMIVNSKKTPCDHVIGAYISSIGELKEERESSYSENMRRYSRYTYCPDCGMKL